MAKDKDMEIFAYSWKATHDDDTQSIRIYGINEGGENTCLRVENFTPYVYVELPDKGMAGDVVSFIGDNLLSYDILEKTHLYNFSGSSSFLFCQCQSVQKVRNITYSLTKPVKLPGHSVPIKLKVHEQSASPILQLVSLKNLPTSGWVGFDGKRVPENNQITRCTHEYVVKWKNLKKSKLDRQVHPKVMAFDLEVNSETLNSMPCNRPDDTIFQISCVFEDEPNQKRRILLVLGKATIEDVEVRSFHDEEELLLGFFDLIREETPNVITGFNILGFDINYMVQRCERYYLTDELKSAGFNMVLPADEERIKWSSSAYRNQEFTYIDWEGILLMDLLPIIRRDYKMDNYKLQTIATTFLGRGKDPITPKDICEAYRTGEMNEVGKYCVKDSELCIDLLNHLHCWIALSEMAKVCNVGMFDLYARGQQLKIYSQVYKYCLGKNIVVDSDGYTAGSNESYTGAYVFDPIPGYYNRVVPLDFSSLYPSLIIAYNICYSTIVGDEVPDDQCNTFEWEDHVNCEHDPKIVRYDKLTNNINDLSNDGWWLRCVRDNIKSHNIPPGTTTKGEKQKIQNLINEINQAIKPIRKLRRDLQMHIDMDQEITTPNRKLVHELKTTFMKRYLKSPIKLKGTIIQLESFRDFITTSTITVGQDVLKEKFKIQELIDGLKEERNIKVATALVAKKKLGTDNGGGRSATKVICAERRYRFYKSEVKKGVIPTIIQNLLASRKAVKAKLKTTTDPGEKIVLDKEQLAYKVSANSMYGAMGVNRGYLPFMPGAMCVTYSGRKAIEKAAHLIKTKWNGKIIYGDTDSNYVVFPQIDTVTETWDYALKVANGVSAEYPAPMKLEFENTIYERFLILSKKRYMYQEANRDGVLDPKIGKKGVILARRDNSGFLRQVYEKTVAMIFDKDPNDNIRDYLINVINDLFRNTLDQKLYVITKAVGDSSGDELNEEGRLGNYKITKTLPEDEEERRKILGNKSEREYYILQCPSQVQLAEKMKRRGVAANAGSRLEFVVLDIPTADTLGQRLEDYDYFHQRARYLPLDKLYYLTSLINPIDQMLNVFFEEPDFIAAQYKIRKAYEMVKREFHGLKIKVKQ